MGAGAFYLCCMSFASPFLAIFGILAYFQIRRSVWKRNRRKRRRALSFCPSSAALGAVFILITTFYRPRIDFAIEARLQKEVEEDDQGDPETPEKLFNHQLRRIRRGEPVETLELRL